MLTQPQQLLHLIALSGEIPSDVISRYIKSKSYCYKVMTKLKQQGYIKKNSADRMKGYRLTSKAKNMLLATMPERFDFYFSGYSDSNFIRTDSFRRQRLHSCVDVYATLLNAGAVIYRDEKPLLSDPGARLLDLLQPNPYEYYVDSEAAGRFPSFNPESSAFDLSDTAVFYTSREIKEWETAKGYASEELKIRSSRAIGALFTHSQILAVYNTGLGTMVWSDNIERRLFACLNVRFSYYSENFLYGFRCVNGLMTGADMDTVLKLFHSDGGIKNRLFKLGDVYERFYYVPNTPEGEIQLGMLCSRQATSTLHSVISEDLAPQRMSGIENDAYTQDGLSVLFAFDFDMRKIYRFANGLRLHGLKGEIYCYDFQKSVLEQYAGDVAEIKTAKISAVKKQILDKVKG